MAAVRKRKRRSGVWEYFTPDEESLSATCRVCETKIRTSGGSTSGLSRHLSTIHQIYLKGLAQNSDKVPPHETICKLEACDGIPFSTIAQSESIQSLLKEANQCQLPASPNIVREIVLKYSDQMKTTVMNDIKKMKISGRKFTLTLDEWTSAANRRYMNVNLHYNISFWNLGLARVTGSFTADACLSLLNSKLHEYDIKLEDIFAIVTDGAAVMKSFGRLSGRKHQLCLAHGIHLAVVDVMYKKNTRGNNVCRQSNAVNEENIATDRDSSPERDDADDAFESSFIDEPGEEIQYEGGLSDIICRVRKTVNMFRLSPKKTEILQKFSATNSSPGPVLLLDTRTRWNSLLVMLERYIALKDAIQKAFIDLKEPLLVSEEDIEVIEEVVNVLKPVKLAVEAICRRDATLIDADVCVQFMMTNLCLHTSAIALRLFDSVTQRLAERRTDLSEVLSYLHFGNDEELQGHRDGYFSKILRSDLIARIKQLHEIQNARVPSVEVQMADLDFDDTEVSQSLLRDESLELQLNQALNTARSFKPGKSENPSSSRQMRDPNALMIRSIKKEMEALENFGTRGRILKPIFDMLMTIPPSTVESERVFSSSKNFCRKSRSRLGDKSMDALVFLKSFFQKHKQ